MIPSRALLISLLALWLVFLSVLQIPIVQSIVGDPPSVFNRGDGGLSELVSALTVFKKIKAVRNFDEIWQYDPSTSVLLLSGLDNPLRESDASIVLEWVESGGKVVVLDEYVAPRLLLEKVSVSLDSLTSSIALGECRLGSSRYQALFNVYREVLGGSPICWVQNTVVGVEVAIGRGVLLVLGDSSTFINEVLRSRYRHFQIVFALALLDRDTVVLYEGGRAFAEILFSPRGLVLLPYFIGRFAWYTILSGGLIGAAKTIFAGLILIAIVSPRWLTGLTKLAFSFKYRRRSARPSVDKLFRESVRVWIEWVNKIGK